MIRYRYLALDLDGTLTNGDKDVSIKNRSYIKKAIDYGVKIILASGRPVIGIKNVAMKLNLCKEGGYIIAYNGGQIIDCLTDKDIFKKCIPFRFYHDICSIGKQYHVFSLNYKYDSVICEDIASKYVQKEAYNNSIPLIKVDNLENEINEPVVKFMVVGEPDELKKAYGYLKEKIGDELNIFFSEPYFMEITPVGIEKASALEYLMNYLGGSSDELMACGDGLNDIPMLQYAGLSAAMGNASEKVKEQADYVVSTNEDDGVAEAIEKYILNNVNK